MSRGIAKRNDYKVVSQALGRIFREHPDEDLTRHQIEQFVLPYLPPDWVEGIRDGALGRALGQILRSQTFKDEIGDDIRKFHSYKQFQQDSEGHEEQRVFWRDIATMSRRQMFLSYQERKIHARDVDRRADKDVEWWNNNVALKLGEKPIQLGMFGGNGDTGSG